MSDQHRSDDERARMAANLGGIIAIMIVLGLGYWLIGALMQQSKNEDCLMAHRRSCGSAEGELHVLSR